MSLLDLSTPRSMIRLALETIQQSAATARLFVPWPETRLSLQEFQNKLDAFKLFEHVDSVLQLWSQSAVSLGELVRRTERLDPYRAVWATEGLGHYWANRSWIQGKPPQNLLTDERCELPAKNLCALHAGMGLAFADQLMKTLDHSSREAEIRSVLERFITVCRENSKAGYAGMAYESLGLVTRNLYPHMIPQVQQELRKFDEPLLEYFWHGVGRGIYFAPANFFPDSSSSKRALQMTRQQPSDNKGRINALSGFSWAMTLVNIRHPEILENFLRHHANELNDGFTNGVSSAVIIWQNSAPNDRSLDAFCEYKTDPVLAAQWEQMVRRPCRESLSHIYPTLQKQQSFEDVFRYLDLSKLRQSE
jgi:hypothetical protein